MKCWKRKQARLLCGILYMLELVYDIVGLEPKVFNLKTIVALMGKNVEENTD